MKKLLNFALVLLTLSTRVVSQEPTYLLIGSTWDEPLASERLCVFDTGTGAATPILPQP
jgi:hypothetical protein